jgi:hypothetical protein
LGGSFSKKSTCIFLAINKRQVKGGEKKRQDGKVKETKVSFWGIHHQFRKGVQSWK